MENADLFVSNYQLGGYMRGTDNYLHEPMLKYIDTTVEVTLAAKAWTQVQLDNYADVPGYVPFMLYLLTGSTVQLRNDVSVVGVAMVGGGGGYLFNTVQAYSNHAQTQTGTLTIRRVYIKAEHLAAA